MKFSDQAIGSIVMVLQKGLAGQGNILEILRDFELTEDDGVLTVLNPPTFQVDEDKGEEEESAEV